MSNASRQGLLSFAPSPPRPSQPGRGPTLPLLLSLLLLSLLTKASRPCSLAPSQSPTAWVSPSRVEFSGSVCA